MNFKHFEQLWEYTELVTQDMFYSPEQSKEIVINTISQSELSSMDFGTILFHLCNLSRITGINTFAALQVAAEDAKIDKLETTS